MSKIPRTICGGTESDAEAVARRRRQQRLEVLFNKIRKTVGVPRYMTRLSIGQISKPMNANQRQRPSSARTSTSSYRIFADKQLRASSVSPRVFVSSPEGGRLSKAPESIKRRFAKRNQEIFSVSSGYLTESDESFNYNAVSPDKKSPKTTTIGEEPNDYAPPETNRSDGKSCNKTEGTLSPVPSNDDERELEVISPLQEHSEPVIRAMSTSPVMPQQAASLSQRWSRSHSAAGWIPTSHPAKMHHTPRIQSTVNRVVRFGSDDILLDPNRWQTTVGIYE